MPKITIKDIAVESGFSLKTVSRVLNDEKYVKNSTKEKILKIIDDLNFEPDYFAKNLKSKKTRTIGLILGDIENPYYSSLSKGVIDYLEMRDYTTMLCNTNYNSEICNRYINALASKEIDGIILSSLKVPDKTIDKIISKNIPLVLIEVEYESFPDLDCINFDSYGAEVLAAEYLISLGHERIFYLVGPKILDVDVRIKGFRDTLKKHKIIFDNSYFSEPLISFEDGYACVKKMIESKSGFTAIIAVNDFIALGVMKAVYDMGLEIPRDISLIGFDDIKYSSISRVPLTTVSEPDYELGRLSAERLIRKIENPKERILPRKITIKPELIIRDSCKPNRFSN